MGIQKRLDSTLRLYHDCIASGEGLSSGMVSTLKSHPVLPEMLWKAIAVFLDTEDIFAFAGDVAFPRMRLFRLLVAAEPEFWTKEPSEGTRLVLAQVAPALAEVSRLRYQFAVFSAAITLGVQAGLIERRPRNRVGLRQDLLAAIRAQLGLPEPSEEMPAKQARANRGDVA